MLQTVPFAYLVFSFHRLTQLPFLSLSFRNVDLSRNRITDTQPIPVPYRKLTYVDLTGNTFQGPMPVWVAPSSSTIKTNGSLYSCPVFAHVDSNLASFKVDGSFYNYSYCRCDDGTFGAPPDCESIPVVDTVSMLGAGTFTGQCSVSSPLC